MYNEIITKIKEYDTIVIARHVGVDPDALCSQLARRDSIRLTYPNKKVSAVGTGSAKFAHIGRLDKLEKFNNALLIVCDTPDRKRIDSVDPTQFSYVIKIDHHPFVEKIGDIELIDDTKTSASEIIMELILNTELLCDKDIAELLYMGVVSDSNRFLFNNCSSSTFRNVSDILKDYELDLGSIYNKLYLRPMSEVRLQGYISLNMKVTENKLGYIVVPNDIICEYEVDSASAGNMVNEFNFIKEVLVWATITEDIKNDQYRISIRSRGPEINKVAESFNGGGHKFASGVRCKTLDEALEVMKALDLELLKYNNSLLDTEVI